MTLKRIAIVLVVLAVLAFIAFLIWFNGDPQGNQPHVAEGSPVVGAVGNVINLEHGWAVDTQQAYYFSDQGSRILRYSWFLNLEQALNETPFGSNDNIEKYRYLPATSTDWNPDALPIGFAKNIASVGEEWLGLTCAACHTTQLSYKGTNIRIDGGPALADFDTFSRDLVDALQATHDDDAKFDRFANGVFNAGYRPDDKDLLRAALNTQTLLLRERNCRNHPLKELEDSKPCPASFASELLEIPNPPQPYGGYARVDAIGIIFNQVMGDFAMAAVPNNAHPSDAPVSYPFLWGTHQSDVVQWTGFAPNTKKLLSFGTLIRNAGEVMGVYGQVDVPTDTSIETYDSSLNIRNLGELEMWVGILRSPRWPSDPNILPAIDTASAERGEALFTTYCVGCHEVIPRGDEGKPYNACMLLQSDVKTDPREIDNMARSYDSGRFDGRKFLTFVFTETTPALLPGTNINLGALLKHPLETFEAAVFASRGGVESGTEAGLTTADHLAQPYAAVFTSPPDTSANTASASCTKPGATYKARPLNGIWATAPYLHNGSVPNLYELLLPASQRSKTFFVGTREFDPIKVGFVNDTSFFEFDTTLTGNSNEGHEYGTDDLNDKQRMELVEYMKTLGQ